MLIYNVCLLRNVYVCGHIGGRCIFVVTSHRWPGCGGGEGEFFSPSTRRKLLVFMEASPIFVDDSVGSAEKPSGGMPGRGWETHLEVGMPPPH